MRFQRTRIVATACVAALVAACSGRNPSPLPQAASGASIARLAQAQSSKVALSGSHRHPRKGRLEIRIRVPKRRHRRSRGPRYISAATKGMTMAFSGPTSTTQVVNLTPSDPRCSGTPLSCTVAVALLAGSYTVTIDTYDAAPVSGSIPAGANLLSTAVNAPFTMKGGVANSIGITLGGVPASLVVSGLPSGTANSPFGAPQSFSVTAKDADGDVITGTYRYPVTLSDSDTTGATSIATSGSDSPPAGELLSSSDTATLGYTGLAIAPATITARATGATDGTGTFTPALQPIVVATSDSLNPSFAGVDLYATSGAGSTGSFSASEVGYTNAPYNKTIQATPDSSCASVGSVSATGNSFSVTVVGSPTPGNCFVTLSDGAGQSQTATLAYTKFAYSGAQQNITVPSGVTQMTVKAAGAAGGHGGDYPPSGAGGGGGGFVEATMPVSPGGALAILAGGAGGAGNAGAGGFNGGGTGGSGPGGGGGGGGGGGATEVLQNGILLIVAGGGGGGGTACCGGGSGGATTGGNGGSGLAGGGQGGSGSAGGAGGVGYNGATDGVVGSSLAGGTGGTGSLSNGSPAGGGGAGYYGGGGGGGCMGCSSAGGGGGGSSFVEVGATNVTNTQGGQNGNGSVVLIW
jgi:hypothetical protein